MLYNTCSTHNCKEENYLLSHHQRIQLSIYLSIPSAGIPSATYAPKLQLYSPSRVLHGKTFWKHQEWPIYYLTNLDSLEHDRLSLLITLNFVEKNGTISFLTILYSSLLHKFLPTLKNDKKEAVFFCTLYL